MTIAWTCLVCLLLGGRESAKKEEPPKVPVHRLDLKSGCLRGILLSNSETSDKVWILELSGKITRMERSRISWLEKEGDERVCNLPAMALVEGLDAEELEVQDTCEQLLTRMGDPAAEALQSALKSKSRETLRRSLRALTKNVQPKLRSSIASLLSHADEHVRKEALAAYGATRPKDLLERSRKALRDSSARVRHEAIAQIESTKDLRAVDSLLEMLEDEDERSLRMQVFASLRRLTGRRLGQDEAAWRAWWTNHREEVMLGG